MILVVVGSIGSGKSTVARVLTEEGFDVIELGDIWRELIHKNKIPMDDPRATREFTMNLRKKEGKDIYAKYALKRIKKSMKHVVIMGVRTDYELNYLKKHIKKIDVIAIVSPLKMRFKRLKMRGKPEDPKTKRDFMWLERRERRGFMSDKSEEKHGVMVLIKNADYVISNVGTTKTLRHSINQVMKNIKESSKNSGWQDIKD